MKKKISDILIEAENARKKAKRAEDTIVVFHEPTKDEIGYAVYMRNDPEIDIVEIEKGTKRYHHYVYKGKYYKCWGFGSRIPLKYVEEFISALKELIDMEIEV